MECPFELPVKKERLQNTGFVNGCVKLYRIEPLLIPYTEEEADYIVQAINSHEKLVEALERIQRWQQAYPLKVFPKPDLKKARKVLKDAGMTLDAISADNMRHVLDSIKDIVEQALEAEKKE